MKFNVLLIAALITISAGINAVAKEDPRNVGLAVVPVKGSEVFKVIYKGETTSKVRINIYNSDAQIIFSEVVSGTDGFIRPLNFGGLKAGEYTVELVEGATKKTEKILYVPVKAAGSAKNVHIARINELEGKFLVSIQNAGKEAITVKIVDRYDNVLFTETREITGGFAQVYRVKNSVGVRFEIYDAAGLNKLSRF
jgi:hypothetical protein